MMPPWMKRLCEAAEPHVSQLLRDDAQGRDVTAEPIVRAVLMALREPSEAMEEAARACTPNDFERWAPATEFEAMINAILAEPAKA